MKDSLRASLTPVAAIRATLQGVMAVTAYLPHAKARRNSSSVIKDIPYRPGGDSAHFLDVIRYGTSDAIQPALLYIHGGGFAVCSKETHEIVTYAYARMGFTVFSINYRLMPEHRFPAAFHDSCDALLWVMNNAGNYRADASQLVIGGESAGGNLSLGVTLASCFRDANDSMAAKVYDASPSIRAVIPACGVLQVSGISRFWRDSPKNAIARSVLTAMQNDYLPLAGSLSTPAIWADPLLVAERGTFDRPLPPLFTFCGTKDVVVDDTRRLIAALQRRGATHEGHIVEDEGHAFHAMVWRDESMRVWRQQREFLSRYVTGLTPSPINEKGLG